MKRTVSALAVAAICACGPLLGLDDYEKANCVRNCDGSVTPEGSSEGGAKDAPPDEGLVIVPEAGASPQVWAGWPMPHEAGTGAPNPVTYALVNSVVTDSVTKLEWQANVDRAETTRDRAVSYCAQLDLNGTGWRLPARIELVSLLDQNGAVHPYFTSSVGVEPHWSSSIVYTSGVATGEGWSVDLAKGDVKRGPGSRVRCVRGAAVRRGDPYAPFDRGTEIIHDELTNLRWERRPSFKTATQAEAQQRCALLTLGGAGGWRLPTTKELSTLLHENAHREHDGTSYEQRFLFQNAFDPTPRGRFRTQGGRCVDFYTGNTEDCGPAEGLFSRCVKLP